MNNLFIIIAEFLKAVVWPLVVLIFLIYNRKELKSFIGRVNMVKFPFGTFASDEDQKLSQQKEDTNDKEVDDIVSRLKGEYESRMNQTEAASNELRNEVESLKMQLDFERVYVIIFGSQLQLLSRLMNGPFVRKTLDQYYGFVKNMYPVFSSWDLDSYLSFLLRKELVSWDFQTGELKITQKGEVFLNYINKLGYVLNKPL